MFLESSKRYLVSTDNEMVSLHEDRLMETVKLDQDSVRLVTECDAKVSKMDKLKMIENHKFPEIWLNLFDRN